MTDAAARVHRRARERGGVAGGGAGAAGRPGAAHRRAHAGPETDPVRKTRLSTLTQGLAALGWIDGRNLRMDIRWTGGDTNRIRAFAQELVGLQPDIILTNATVATVALQRETQTIPIVFVDVGDPVPRGIVPRPDRPSGNATGFALYEASMGGSGLSCSGRSRPGSSGSQ